MQGRQEVWRFRTEHQVTAHAVYKDFAVLRLSGPYCLRIPRQAPLGFGTQAAITGSSSTTILLYRFNRHQCALRVNSPQDKSCG
jgi:hypothetical protein